MFDNEGDDEEELVEAVRASEEDLARPPLEGVHLCWSYPSIILQRESLTYSTVQFKELE